MCAAVKILSSTSSGNIGGKFSLIELAISCIIRFANFFEPVAIASMQASFIDVTIHYRNGTASLASASNCIHALRKSNNIVTMPTRDILLRHFCKMSLTVVYTVAHPFSYVLLVGVRSAPNDPAGQYHCHNQTIDTGKNSIVLGSKRVPTWYFWRNWLQYWMFWTMGISKYFAWNGSDRQKFIQSDDSCTEPAC